MAKNKLSPKQELFCREYLKDFNATQAAMRAHYSEKTAASQAARLLQNVKILARINSLKVDQHERINLSADAVLQEIASLAMIQVDHFSQWDGKEFSIKPFSEMHPIAKKAIKEIKVIQIDSNVKRIVDKDTGNEIETKDRKTIMEVKLHSKGHALELLADHYNLLNKTEGVNADEALHRALASLEEEEMKSLEMDNKKA